ncbi:hypothetical protein K402DRAFT_464668 [Aulographum hederae CBS 113979]|uniref:Uncharacterized protein n=1 Tax=Aulographum hederae CBS 113979 TaxID=1176131 RepID=A0A6G1GWA2_9PEZI|nr:hypothetical protein K402DRAFT_464668 [Aulographum hederae CBS 113979]
MAPQNTSGEALSAGSIASFMAASLPKDASPQLKNEWDAVALAAHSGMIAVGFRLRGLGEDHLIDASSDAQDAKPLPEQWNSTSGSYAFRYAHSQSSMEFLVKVTRLSGKALVYAIGIGHDKTAQFELEVRDYISPSNLPSTPLSSSTSLEDAHKTLQDVFISPGRLADLGALLKVSVIQKLAPGIRKEGYEDDQTTTATSSSRGQQERAPRRQEEDRPTRDPLREPQPPPAQPHPFNDPLAAPPSRQTLPEPIPGFEDEHEILRGPRGGIGGRQPQQDYGYNDLYPQGMGPQDPFRPHFGGPPPLRSGGLGGGGMHPTFDDPLFAGRGGRGGMGGAMGGQAPPGARWEPAYPGQEPPQGSGGHPGSNFPGRMGGGPPNPFRGFGEGDFL